MKMTSIGRAVDRVGRLGPWALAGGACLLTRAAWAVNDLPGGPGVRQIDMQEPITEIAVDQRWLHYFMLAICLLIFVGVFGVMFYSIFKHRRSRGAKAANFHESTTVEIIWTIVPFLIVIGMALPATKVVVAMKDTSAADLTIKATGMQWQWGYDYLKGEGEGIGFISRLDIAQRMQADTGHPEPVDDYLLKVDNPLVVPVDKKVRVITTAGDVIHSWGVPSFGVKQDAIPGFVRDTWFRANKVGNYHGQCVELCGKEHAFMPIQVIVLSAADYSKWVDGKKKEMMAAADDPAKVWTLADLSARGEKVYSGNCAVCHLATGKGGGPVKPLDGSAVVLNADRGAQIHVLLEGRANGAMPSWKQLSDTEIAAVITYTKNNWSNKTGQVVQPADVAGVRVGREPAPGATADASTPAPAGPASTTTTSAVAPAAVTAAAPRESPKDAPTEALKEAPAAVPDLKLASAGVGAALRPAAVPSVHTVRTDPAAAAVAGVSR